MWWYLHMPWLKHMRLRHAYGYDMKNASAPLMLRRQDDDWACLAHVPVTDELQLVRSEVAHQNRPVSRASTYTHRTYDRHSFNENDYFIKSLASRK